MNRELMLCLSTAVTNKARYTMQLGRMIVTGYLKVFQCHAQSTAAPHLRRFSRLLEFER